MAMDWAELNAEILLQLDIKREYETIGVQFTGMDASHSGWLPCSAIDREDNNPSAAVNIGQDPNLRGRYKDHGGSGISMGMWDFAARYGSFSDWQDARKHYGRSTNLSNKFPKADQRLSIYSFEPRATQPADQQFDLYTQQLVAAYPGTSARALRACGAVYGKYPCKAPHPQWVAAIPTFGPYLQDGGIKGYQVAAVDGGPVLRYRGKDAPPDRVKRLTLGNDGLMGLDGIQKIQNGCQHVLKMGGYSDLLAAQDVVMETGIELAVVSGAGEGARHYLDNIAPVFAGCAVYVVHDADEPGQIGAKAWVGALRNAGVTAGRLKLPFPVTERRGLDLRDWLLKMCEQHAQSAAPTSS